MFNRIFNQHLQSKRYNKTVIITGLNEEFEIVVLLEGVIESTGKAIFQWISIIIIYVHIVKRKHILIHSNTQQKQYQMSQSNLFIIWYPNFISSYREETVLITDHSTLQLRYDHSGSFIIFTWWDSVGSQVRTACQLQEVATRRILRRFVNFQ